MLYVLWRWLIGFLFPFVLALLVAVALEPLVEVLKKKGASTPVAVIVGLLAGVGGIMLLLGVVLTLLLSELMQLSHSLPGYLALWQRTLDGYLLRLGEIRRALGVSPQSLHAQLGALYRVLESLLRNLLGVLIRLPDMVLTIVVALVAAFFILRDKRRVGEGFRRLLPPGLGPHVSLVKADIVAGTLGFLKAQVTLIGLTAASTATGLILIGAHYAVLLGVLAGLLDLVPFMGPTALLLPWAIVLFVTGQTVQGLKVLTVLTGVAIVRQLVEPRIVGENTGLHPLVVLFSLYVGIRLFGAMGFVAGPISAVILRAIGRAMDRGQPSDHNPRRFT